MTQQEEEKWPAFFFVTQPAPRLPGAKWAPRYNGNGMVEPLVGMDLTDLCEALGPAEPGYRARQIYQAIYRHMLPNWFKSRPFRRG